MDEQTNPTHDHSPSELHGPARRRLGRGLHALLGGGGGGGDERPPIEAEAASAELHQLPIEVIDRNPFQPRQDFDPDSLHELAESIKQHGLLQPVLVRAHGPRYQLIAGERRWLAAKKAGLQCVPCRVLELDDRRVCEAAIEENLKRKDLNVLEKAQAFQSYLDRFGSSIEELARQLSMDRSTVSNYLRLLELPDVVKHALRTDKISNGHARALLPLGEADQIALCRRIQSESLSVRKTEEAVRAIQKAQTEPAAQAVPPEGTPAADGTVPFPTGEEAPQVALSNHVLSLRDQLRDALGLKVEIRLRGKDAGKIIIDFNSNDEFERLIRQLRRAA